MRKPLLFVVFVAVFTVLCLSSAEAQQSATLTWSSSCTNCESSISNPGWYSDGSGIFVEGTHGSTVGAIVGLSRVEGYFCVELGIVPEGQGTVAVNPRRAVTLETDSTAHMVLYPIDHPDSRVIKGTVIEKKRLKDETVTLKGEAVAAGYLLFPADNNASRVTVVVVVGGETFRFPFDRNPDARGKFSAPNDSVLVKQKVLTLPSSSAPVQSPVAQTAQQSAAAGNVFDQPASTSGSLLDQAIAQNRAEEDRQHVSSSHSTEQLEACQKQIDAQVYPANTCTAILGYLAPADELGPGPFEDGSFLVITRGADGASNVRTYYLPPTIRSEIALKTMRQTLQDVQSLADKEPNGIFAGMLPDGRDLWTKLVGVYCYYHPDEQYGGPSGTLAKCYREGSLPDDKTLESDFDGAMVYKNNYLTFLDARVAQKLDTAPATAPTVPPSEAQTSAGTAVIAGNAKIVHPVVQSGCDKNISFAVAGGGQIVSRVPAFAEKWISRNQKKYAGLCFSQVPDPQAANYLLVFSTSQSAFNGIYPTVRTNTNTSTSTTPVSGSGIVTDNYGGMWNYTYDGTATTTTTTTTTTHENLPYTDTSNTLYLNSYDQHGGMISQRWRTITTRQGGDGANTLGYNLGAALGAIHMKEHLLKSVVEDVTKRSK
jgi:hypothetical protein